jgi:hypothetical protein
MANSPFKKVKITTPVAPDKGGTGVRFLEDKGVLVGALTNSVGSILPGTSGNILVSDGTSWVSGNSAIEYGTVTYSKLSSDLVDSVVISASDIDWSQGSIFTKTLTANTTLTFSNYQLGKNIFLEIDGYFSLSFPSSVIIISGEYIGSVLNYISLHCTNATSGNEEVWVTINQSLN